MRNLKLVIEYDGSSFFGWAAQPGKRTVEAELQKAIKAVLGATPKLKVAGRTDSGVHALDQTVNFHTRARIPAERLFSALRRHLPDDIVVKSAEDVPFDFDSRRSARARTYNYQIVCGSYVPVRLKRYAWHVKGDLDIKKMMKAAKKLEGLHDFMSFCTKESYNKTFLRRVFYVRALEKKYPGAKGVKLINIEIRANAFLHKMVRTIVGTLVDVGRGKTDVDKLESILSKKDRSAAGATAPARGLSLIKVDY